MRLAPNLDSAESGRSAENGPEWPRQDRGDGHGPVQSQRPPKPCPLPACVALRGKEPRIHTGGGGTGARSQAPWPCPYVTTSTGNAGDPRSPGHHQLPRLPGGPYFWGPVNGLFCHGGSRICTPHWPRPTSSRRWEREDIGKGSQSHETRAPPPPVRTSWGLVMEGAVLRLWPPRRSTGRPHVPRGRPKPLLRAAKPVRVTA